MNILEGTAGKTAGAIAISEYDRQRQLENATKMHEMQIAGSKEMGTFNQGLAIDTFMKTQSPMAQRKMMEQAGLNVGMMYSGGGGGGGATTTAGNVPTQSMNPQSIGMALTQMQNLATGKAEQKNIEADTKKKEVEAEKLAGVDTQVAGATLEQIKTETTNEKVKTAINEYEADIKEIEAQTKNMTQWDTITEIKASAGKLAYEANIAKNEGKISDETYQSVIKQINTGTVEQQLRIASQQQGLSLGNEQMKKMATEIYNMQQEQGYKERDLTIREKQLLLNKMGVDMSTSTPEQIKQWTSIITDILKAGR